MADLFIHNLIVKFLEHISHTSHKISQSFLKLKDCAFTETTHYKIIKMFLLQIWNMNFPKIYLSYKVCFN